MMRGPRHHDSKFSRPTTPPFGLRRSPRRRDDPVGPRGPGAAEAAGAGRACSCSRSATACTLDLRPRLGALGAGRGGKGFALLARALAVSVAADDVAAHPSTTPRRWPTIPTRPSCMNGSPTPCRSEGAPLLVVSQKSLTGHAKGGAAVFQMMGFRQMLRDGVIPPTAVRPRRRRAGRLRAFRVGCVDTLRLAASSTKAGMLTSLVWPCVGPGRVGIRRASSPAGSRTARGLPAACRRLLGRSCRWPSRLPVVRRRTSACDRRRPPRARAAAGGVDAAESGARRDGEAYRADPAVGRRTCAQGDGKFGVSPPWIHARRVLLGLTARHLWSVPAREAPNADRIVAGLGHRLTWPHGQRRWGSTWSPFLIAEQLTSPERCRRDLRLVMPGRLGQEFVESWSATAKEAVIKAPSGSYRAAAGVAGDIRRDIEVTDMWGAVRADRAIAEHLADVTIHVS